MQRHCDSCGTTYEAKRKSSRFCSDTCRKRAQRAPQTVKPEESSTEALRRLYELEYTTRSQLEAVGRLNTVLGQQALMLAHRICSPMETGGAVASLSKEFRAVMDAAMDGVDVAENPLDELRERRDRKRAAG